MNDETPETLLKGALERIVYFEARSSQLANDVERSVAEAERFKAELARAAQREIELKRTVAELEVRVSRADTERDEATLLADALRREQAGLVANILDASRIHGTEVVDGFDLAQFIAQLRSEVLRTRVGANPERGVVRAERGPQGTPATRMAHELKSAGRLSVSEADVDTLANGAAFPKSEETLFGFSVRELSATDVAARARAAERLAALSHRAAAPALASALNLETEPRAQVAMLKALSALAGPEGAAVVKPLLAAPSPEVRIAALKALLKLDPKAAGPHLAAATSDPEPTVRRRASLLALGLPPKDALELGVTSIRDANAEVRALATLVLGASQADAARPLLLEAMRDPDIKVRRSASQALSNLLGQDVTKVVELNEAHRRREVRRLSSVQPVPVADRRSVREARLSHENGAGGASTHGPTALHSTNLGGGTCPTTPGGAPTPRLAVATGNTSSRLMPAHLAPANRQAVTAEKMAASARVTPADLPSAPTVTAEKMAASARVTTADLPSAPAVAAESIAASSRSSRISVLDSTAVPEPTVRLSDRAPSARAVGFLASGNAWPADGGQRAPASRTAVITATSDELVDRLMGELRASLRGKSLPDLTLAADAPSDDVVRALSLLLSKGAVVRRGLKYFVA